LDDKGNLKTTLSEQLKYVSQDEFVLRLKEMRLIQYAEEMSKLMHDELEMCTSCCCKGEEPKDAKYIKGGPKNQCKRCHPCLYFCCPKVRGLRTDAMTDQVLAEHKIEPLRHKFAISKLVLGIYGLFNFFMMLKDT
jgi:hypothetical protein